jgi:hypothetical protein
MACGEKEKVRGWPAFAGQDGLGLGISLVGDDDTGAS